MDSTSRRLVRRIRATQRGVSLIEGMIAAVVFLIGLMGVFQGILVAGRQNAIANLATRASGISSQVKGALDTLGRSRVVGTTGHPGLLSGAACNPSDEVRALTGGLEDLKPASGEAWALRCIFDLDAFERTASDADRLLPGYSSADFGHYRRVLAVIEKPDEVTGVTMHQVIIVVSWMEVAQRRYVRQYVSFYDPGDFGNDTHVEI